MVRTILRCAEAPSALLSKTLDRYGTVHYHFLHLGHSLNNMVDMA